ncbi:ogr/Delta-like zinc finger family protein [Marinomonas shanghaiensis]|uniref:ogr/Delta-like zinc finger family protein n=1 Tax=Marinomonas shanghaiensis TaxID=2202418 RepID=UPI000DB8FF06|nr:ogr/Delta-like zinc finger family protein [Marinomonas shanghaiensis]
MRVICPHCHSKALITSSNVLCETVKDLYCQCTNTKDCGASFVYKLSHSHDLNPPRQTTVQIAIALIKSLPIEERQALQRDVFAS